MPHKQPPVEHQFKPGQSGNPKGKPKGIPNSKTVLQRFFSLTEKTTNPINNKIEELNQLEILVLKQMANARKGDTRAFDTLMDRAEGRPAQTVEVSGDLDISFVNKVPVDDSNPST